MCLFFFEKERSARLRLERTHAGGREKKENISINLTTHVVQAKQTNTSWRQQTDMDDRGTLTKKQNKTVMDVVCAPCNVSARVSFPRFCSARLFRSCDKVVCYHDVKLIIYRFSTLNRDNNKVCLHQKKRWICFELYQLRNFYIFLYS